MYYSHFILVLLFLLPCVYTATDIDGVLRPNNYIKPNNYGVPNTNNYTEPKANPGLCDPYLLYDATLVFIADLSMDIKDVFSPMSSESFAEAMPKCVRKLRKMFGLETEAFWKGTGPAPFGFTGSNNTALMYRLYGLATPEYNHHFPITNGLVYDDIFLLEVMVEQALNGEWGMMMTEMGMSNVVAMGTVISCGQYRIFENDTTGMSQLAPSIGYYTPMPMMPMFTTPDMDLYNSMNTVYLALEQCWWGEGQSFGNSVTTLASDGTFTAEIFNVLTFPPSVVGRQFPPRYKKCEPLPPSQ